MDGVKSGVVEETNAIREGGGSGNVHGNRGLIILLCLIGVMIVGLTVAIVVVKVTGESEEVTVPEKMDGWDGTISPGTQAMIFQEDVQEKLNNDPDYTVDDAFRDYRDAFDEATGELKFWVATEYAGFVFEYGGSVLEAVQVMEVVHGIAITDPYMASVYYDTLYKISEEGGDVANAGIYKKAYDKVMEYYWNWSEYEEE